jgi:hypothetical protein
MIIFFRLQVEDILKKRPLFIGILVAMIVLMFSFQIAYAHTTIHVGNYDLEIGWFDEPPVVGQRNAVVVNITNTEAADAVVDISKLTVNMNYGGETKTLTLQPLSEDSKNQYIAAILPMIPGQYTVQLRGQLDSTNISSDVQPEEVVSSDTLAFPSAPASQPGNGGMDLNGWLSVIGLIAGLSGFILAFLAYRKAG